MRFHEKIVLVTGAGSGIGRAAARRFAEEGAHVCLADLNREAVQGARDGICEAGGTASAIELDVADGGRVRQTVDNLVAREGRIDILVANAATIVLALTVEHSEEDWDRVMAVNAKGTFLCCQAAARHMLRQHSGAIITVSSIAGKTGCAYHAAYSASKFAVIGFTQVLAAELTRHGIRANCICPGYVDTPMLDLVEKELNQKIVDSHMGRRAHPEEIADAICFLASDDASYISGQAINVCSLGEMH